MRRICWKAMNRAKRKTAETCTLPALDSLVATSRQVVELETHRAEQGALGTPMPRSQQASHAGAGRRFAAVSVLLAWRITAALCGPCMKPVQQWSRWPPRDLRSPCRQRGGRAPLLLQGWRACRAACEMISAVNAGAAQVGESPDTWRVLLNRLPSAHRRRIVCQHHCHGGGGTESAGS